MDLTVSDCMLYDPFLTVSRRRDGWGMLFEIFCTHFSPGGP